MNQQSPMASNVEQLGSGLSREWLYDKRIMTLTFWQSTRETAELWRKVGREALENWPADRPYLLLLDASRAMLTPYARSVAAELAAFRPELGGRTAIVIAPSSLGHIIRLFVNHASMKHHRERRVYFNRDVALAWLEELIG